MNRRQRLGVLLLGCLLAACDRDPGAAGAAGSAQVLPGGTAPIGGGAGRDAHRDAVRDSVRNSVRNEPAVPPELLLEAFRERQPPGIVSHLVPVDGRPALLILEVDAARFDAVLVGTDGARRVGMSAREALEEFALDLVIGSSFVSELNSLAPVGLLQIEGAMLSPLQPHGYTRVLGTGPRGIGVVGTREFHRGLFDSAMQVGPGVVERGALDISERDLARPRYFRTFVATCGTSAMVGASQEPMHLYTLGKRFLEFAAELGRSCDEVVNLAGDREVVLALSAPDRSSIAYFGHPETAKAALLGFRRRAGG